MEVLPSNFWSDNPAENIFAMAVMVFSVSATIFLIFLVYQVNNDGISHRTNQDTRENPLKRLFQKLYRKLTIRKVESEHVVFEYLKPGMRVVDLADGSDVRSGSISNVMNSTDSQSSVVCIDQDQSAVGCQMQKKVKKMNEKIEKLTDTIRYLIRHGIKFPSRLDLTSIPESEVQDYRSAISKVYKEFNIPCPELNFLSADIQARMNTKIDEIIAGISEKAKNGKDVQIRLDIEDLEEFVTSLPPMLINRMRAKLGYGVNNDNTEYVFDDKGKQVAILMQFKSIQ